MRGEVRAGGRGKSLAGNLIESVLEFFMRSPRAENAYIKEKRSKIIGFTGLLVPAVSVVGISKSDNSRSDLLFFGKRFMVLVCPECNVKWIQEKTKV